MVARVLFSVLAVVGVLIGMSVAMLCVRLAKRHLSPAFSFFFSWGKVLGLRAIEIRASQLQHASALIIAEQETRLAERTQKLQPIYSAAAKLRRSSRASSSNREQRREEVLQRGSRRHAKDWGDLTQF